MQQSFARWQSASPPRVRQMIVRGQWDNIIDWKGAAPASSPAEAGL